MLLFVPFIQSADAICKLRSRRPEVLCKNVGTFSGKHMWWGSLFINIQYEKPIPHYGSVSANFKKFL